MDASHMHMGILHGEPARDAITHVKRTPVKVWVCTDDPLSATTTGLLLSLIVTL